MRPVPVTRDSGFTIIEALVVVAITGLIGGLAFPNLDSLIKQQIFRATCSHILSDLKDARAVGISKGHSAHIHVRDDTLYVDGHATTQLQTDIHLRGIGMTDIWFFADGTSTGGRLVITDNRHMIQYKITTSGLISGTMP